MAVFVDSFFIIIDKTDFLLESNVISHNGREDFQKVIIFLDERIQGKRFFADMMYAGNQDILIRTPFC